MDTSYFHMQQQIGLTMIGLLVCYLVMGYFETKTKELKNESTKRIY